MFWLILLSMGLVIAIIAILGITLGNLPEDDDK